MSDKQVYKMKSARMASARTDGGFSMIELLVVIAIVCVLVALGSSILGSVDSQRLEGAARQVESDFTFATQSAQRFNKPVAVRIIEVSDPSRPGSTPQLRAYQVARIDGWTANGTPRFSFLTKVLRLPKGIIFTPSPNYTTLMANAGSFKSSGAGDPNLGESYRFLSYEISPDGSTTLPRSSDTTFTLVVEPQGGQEPTTLPANFRVISLDPISGTVQRY